MRLERRPKIALVFIDEAEAVQISRESLPVPYLAVNRKGFFKRFERGIRIALVSIDEADVA